MKIVVKFVKKFIFGAFLLYGYNLIASNFNMIVPINVFTLIFVTFLGFPSVFGLILFKMLLLWGVL